MNALEVLQYDLVLGLLQFAKLSEKNGGTWHD